MFKVTDYVSQTRFKSLRVDFSVNALFVDKKKKITLKTHSML